MDPNFLGRAAVTLAVLLGSLGFVTWRQSRALEALAAWDEVSSQVTLARATVVELDRDIQVLMSRSRVVPAARERLGMHTPDASELEILEMAPVEVTP